MGKLTLKQKISKKADTITSYDQEKIVQSHETDDFNIADLITTIEDNGQQVDQLKYQYLRVNQKAKLVQEPETRAEQEQNERKVATAVMKQDIKKWLPIVKKNRESEKLDFTKQRNVQTSKVSDVSNVLSNNPLSQRLETAMEVAEVARVEQIVSSNQSERVRQANLAFYNDLKMKRVAKIKSKIYRKIKKRHSEKEKLKLMAQLTPAERRQEMEKLKLDRAKERVTLRHSTKNKFVSQLLRFGGDKTTLKQQQSLINNLKAQMLKKAQAEDEDFEYDDEEFQEQAIAELERELQDIEQREKQKGQGLGFLERQKKEDLQQSKSVINNLLEMLKTNKHLQGDDYIEEEDNSNQPLEIPDDTGVQKFTKTNEGITHPKEQGKFDAKNVLQDFIGEVQPKVIQQPHKAQLIEGLNVKKIREKYEKNINQKLTTTDLKQLQADQDEVLQENLANFNLTIDDNENEDAFVNEKLREYEEEIPKEEAFKKGWGTWTGFGVKERKPPSQEALLKKKIEKIKQLQKTRKDAKLDNVIISEKRNTQFNKYLVQKLPHDFQTPDQFDQLHSMPIGPEWNSLITHDALTQSKVITKAGHIINPVQLPNKINKLM